MSNPKKDKKEDLEELKSLPTIYSSDLYAQTATSFRQIQEQNIQIFEKMLDTANKVQQDVMNRTREFSRNNIELEKGIINSSQSVCNLLIENFYKSIDSNPMIPEKFKESCNTFNQKIVTNIKSTENLFNTNMIETLEELGKSIESIQRFYNNTNQNYLNYVKGL